MPGHPLFGRHGPAHDSIEAHNARERDIAAHPPNPSGGPFALKRPDPDSIIKTHKFEPGVRNEPDRCRKCLAMRDHPAHKAAE